MTQCVRTRFAPSPTGFLHLGGLRTALFNYLFAKHNNGSFILRIEDTDQARSVPGAVEQMHDALQWAGIVPDEGPLTGGSYGPYIQLGAAYRCFCTPEQLQSRREASRHAGLPTAYDRRCARLSERESMERQRQGQPSTLRFRVPPGHTTVHDLLHGMKTFDNATIEDSVLMKSDGMPTYHLANVVDDHLMDISHVMRGEEWLPSAPKHVLLSQALDWSSPAYVHLPLLYNTDHSKLSKRNKHANVRYYQDQHVPPEALINYVALLGWSPKSKQEIFSLKQLVEQFSLNGLNRSGALVTEDKLQWISKQHLLGKLESGGSEQLALQLRELVSSRFGPDCINIELMSCAMDIAYLARVLQISKQRVNNIGEIVTRFPFFFTKFTNFDTEDARTFRHELSAAGDLVLAKLHLHLGDLRAAGCLNSESALKDQLKQLSLISGYPYGLLLRTLRYALTGIKGGPDILATACVLGREHVLLRLQTAGLSVNELS